MNSKYLTKIVAGSLLGDGSVHIPNDGSRNARYSQNKTADHRDYVEWLIERLETITKVSVWDYQPKMQNAKPAIGFQTRTHPFYTKFRDRMYPLGYKSVDPHYLTLLDWEMLAVWYQEDGTIHSRVQGNYQDIQVALRSDSFTYGDNLLLKKALKEKTETEWNVRRMTNKKGEFKYYLALVRSSLPRFIDNIAPFILPSFEYKVRTLAPFI